MAGNRKIKNQYIKSVQRIAGKYERQAGWIGLNATTITADTPDMIYVRLANGQAVRAINKLAPLVYNYPVVIARSESSAYWEVVEVRQPYGVTSLEQLKDHHSQHEYPARDTVWVRAAQFLPLLVLPYSGLTVKIFGGVVMKDGQYYLVENQILDLTGYIPATGAKWALIEIVAGVVTVTLSAEYGSKELLTPDLIPFGTGVRLCAITLYSGQESVQRGTIDEFVDLRFLGGGEAVDSVNGQTGIVVLDYLDVGADPSGSATTAENNAKAYADGLVVGLWDDRGNYDASGGAYPSTGGSGTAGAVKKGDIWTISVAGTLPTSQPVEVGDTVRALVDTPGNTQSNWAIAQNNIGYVAENSANKATTMSGNTTSNVLYLTAKAIYDWAIGLFSQLGHTHTSDKPIAETNANDIFRVNSPGGISAFVGTINGTPSGATLTYTPVSGNEGAMVPASTSQLAKMRLYNTTLGGGAYLLISNCNTGTNQITFTANVPGTWLNGHTIEITSQTVSGGGFSWTDLEITGGPTGQSGIWMRYQINSPTVGDAMRTHPLETFGAGKLFGADAQVAGTTIGVGADFVKITSNVFSLAWTGTPAAVVVREAGKVG